MCALLEVPVVLRSVQTRGQMQMVKSFWKKSYKFLEKLENFFVGFRSWQGRSRVTRRQSRSLLEWAGGLSFAGGGGGQGVA